MCWIKSASWMLTDWCADEKILPKMYHAIEGIDWARDTIIVMGNKSYEPTPEFLAYLRNYHKVSEKRFNFNPVNRYNIDPSAALAVEIKCGKKI